MNVAIIVPKELLDVMAFATNTKKNNRHISKPKRSKRNNRHIGEQAELE